MSDGIGVVIILIVILIGYYVARKISTGDYDEEACMSTDAEGCLETHRGFWEFEENEWVDDEHSTIYYCPVCEESRTNTIPIREVK